MSKELEHFNKDKIVAGLKAAESLTKDFSDDELETLSAITKAELFEQDSLILEEDSISRDILIICRGAGTVELRLRPGTDLTGKIGKIREGAVIGEFSYIDGSRRSADVKALVDTTVLRLPYDKLNMLCGTNNKVGYKIMRNLANLMANRLRNTNFELRGYLYI